MNVVGLSSETPSETDKSADRTGFGTAGAHAAYAPLRDRLLAAARVAEKAAEQHLGEPIRVDVTEQGCTAIMDTTRLLTWAALFEPRPRIERSEANPRYILLRGVIDGEPWALHNGEPAEPAGDTAQPAVAAEVPDAETVRVPVPHPRRAPRRD